MYTLNELYIGLTDDERDFNAEPTTLGYRFGRRSDGGLDVTQVRDGKDEWYAAEFTFNVPPRIWKEAFEWLELSEMADKMAVEFEATDGYML